MKKEPTKTEAPAVTSPAHTPGPWEVCAARNSASPVEINSMTGYVAVIAFNASADAIREPGEIEANARLIAAAPELLAALKTIDANAAESPEWIRRVARKARRKAEGGAK